MNRQPPYSKENEYKNNSEHSANRALPFTSLRSVTIGLGRDFLEGDTRRGQSQGLLDHWLDPEPVVAAENLHSGSTIIEA